MNPPLPTRKAEEAALLLQAALDMHTCLDFEGAGTISTDYLFGPARGQMFGILVCEDASGNEVVLKAFSGQYAGNWTIPGWVGPVVDPRTYEKVALRHDTLIHTLTSQIEQSKAEEKPSLASQRKTLSQSILSELYGLYRFRCIDQKSIGLADVFGPRLPPTGTGDCCGPKLLHHAFCNQLHPVSMAEFFYGEPNRSRTKQHKAFYGPCDEKCQPLLRHMLGLDIVYADESLVVVNKEGGMLSVPGRGEEKQDCVETRVRRLFPKAPRQCAVHRLDMDTSGLLLLALDKETHRDLSLQFMHKKIEKEYQALLEGVVRQEEGEVHLPFRLDVEHRPYQIYDEEQGKWGTTVWKKLRVESFHGSLVTRVVFRPLTGRTHQLRLHSFHPKGIAHPIVGDRLYGTGKEGDRLCLHACSLSFIHPRSGEKLTITSSSPF